MHTLAIGLLAALPAQGPLPDIDYPELTNNRREVPNFNAEVVRGLAPAADGSLYALNSHGSQIVHHMDLTPAPERVFQTIANPVAIGLWGTNRIVVSGAGTHALAIHDVVDGAVLSVVQLPSEPADLVIDQGTGIAYVACQGANVVARVDLATATLLGATPIPAERPRFLYLDRGADGVPSDDDGVLVASFLSFNGSGVIGGSGQRAAIGNSYLLPPGSRLPDEDLFRIDLASPATATPVFKRVGTLLTGHGRHPNGEYWALNVDSRNQNPATPDEPSLRGDFAKNRVWVGALPPAASMPVTLDEFVGHVDLDQPNAQGEYLADGSKSAAFPWGIEFERLPPNADAEEANTRVFICSPLNDCVIVMDANQNFVHRIELPAGSIPMDVELDAVWGGVLFVHCWGSNRVLAYPIADYSGPIPFDLGLDPTPAAVRRGRELWYDAHRSQAARSSCNTCHPGGKADFLGWQISDHPSDRKDVMVTQSLLGIEDTYPFHWRGERALIDFNGAFVDLLGGPEPLDEGEGEEFEDFQAFVFSLQPHANPRQNLERTIPDENDTIVNGAGQTFLGNPQLGLDLFDNRVGFNAMSCAECHTHKSGSNGDFINEVGSDIPSVQTLETPHLRELTHKDQPLFAIPALGLTDYPRSGFGVGHSGALANIFSFIDKGDSFNVSPDEAAHVAAFVRRFDQGIAPAAHFALRVTPTTTNDARIQNVLVAQSFGVTRGIDMAAFGTFVPPGATQPIFARFVRSQVFHPVTPVNFLCSELAPTQTIDLAALLTQVVNGTARLTFLGLPPGSGRRFALDPDNDDFTDFEERTRLPLPTFPFDPDSDDDDQPDGYEVKNPGGDPRDNLVQCTDSTPPQFQFGQQDFVSASVAKYHFESTEPVRVETSVSAGGGAPKLARNPDFARSHTVVVQALEPSTPAGTPSGHGGAFASLNSGWIKAIDRAGLNSTFNFVVTAGDMIHPIGADALLSPLVLTELACSVQSSTDVMKGDGTATIRQRYADPSGVSAAAVTGQVAVFQVLRETATGSNLYEIDPTLTSVNGVVLSTIDLVDESGAPTSLNPAEVGDLFLVSSPADAAGGVTFDFNVSDLDTDQKVRLRLFAVFDPQSSSLDLFRQASFGRVQFPATRPANRGLQFTQP
jgi:hypothetical protein